MEKFKEILQCPAGRALVALALATGCEKKEESRNPDQAATSQDTIAVTSTSRVNASNITFDPSPIPLSTEAPTKGADTTTQLKLNLSAYKGDQTINVNFDSATRDRLLDALATLDGKCVFTASNGVEYVITGNQIDTDGQKSENLAITGSKKGNKAASGTLNLSAEALQECEKQAAAKTPITDEAEQ